MQTGSLRHAVPAERNRNGCSGVEGGMRRRLPAMLALVLVVTAGCGQAGPVGSSGTGKLGAITLARSEATRMPAPSDEAPRAAAAIDGFGLDLYRRLAANGGNLVFSPASVAIALSMARAGARGDTAAQMDQVLHSVGSDANALAIDGLDRALASRTQIVTLEPGVTEDVTLRIANAPFAQRDMHFQSDYLDALAERFAAGVRLVDYKSAAEAARQAINAWVSDQTEQRIPELLDPGILTDATRLTLVNAIYLKAPWETPFDPAATRPGPFTRADGSTISVPMMALQAKLPCGSGAGWQAVELPYVGDSLTLSVIVPDNLASFEKTLDPPKLDRIVSNLGECQMTLGFPKFGIRTAVDLNAQLSALGMPLAFDPDRADFSGITSDEQLFISHVVHQANISVDEKGTEAAAATAVVMDTYAAAQPVVLTVDRPFLFALRDKPTGAILFLGRTTDPSAGS